MAFVEITYSEMALFLKRAFRALDPKPGPTLGGQLTYVLKLSPVFDILIRTSIFEGYDTVRPSGSDVINLGPVYRGSSRPIRRGKFATVKRTNSWKDTMREAIEDLILECDQDPNMGRG